MMLRLFVPNELAAPNTRSNRFMARQWMRLAEIHTTGDVLDLMHETRAYLVEAVKDDTVRQDARLLQSCQYFSRGCVRMYALLLQENPQ